VLRSQEEAWKRYYFFAYLNGVCKEIRYDNIAMETVHRLLDIYDTDKDDVEVVDKCPSLSRDAYRRYVGETVLIRRKKYNLRNEVRLVWTLVAARNIRAGEFVGFYTGSMDKTTCTLEGKYALHMGKSQPCIIPFEDERNISFKDRENHPLSCMNEPLKGEPANCHMVIQDFSHSEVGGSEHVLNGGSARFFRGLACITCENVRKGDDLTWYYGKSYEPIRVNEGYSAGTECTKVLEAEVFVADNSKTVLSAIASVPNDVVFPVHSSLKSSRFKAKRAQRVDSEGEVSDPGSSGSDHSSEYTPRPTKRRS
jgi:hypothetical protein